MDIEVLVAIRKKTKMINKLKKEISTLVSENKTSKAIKVLLVNLSKREDVYQQVLMLSSRLSKLKKDNINGNISHEQLNVENAKINHSILEILDILDEDKIRKFRNVPVLILISLIITGSFFIYQNHQQKDSIEEELIPMFDNEKFNYISIADLEQKANDSISIRKDSTIEKINPVKLSKNKENRGLENNERIKIGRSPSPNKKNNKVEAKTIEVKSNFKENEKVTNTIDSFKTSINSSPDLKIDSIVNTKITKDTIKSKIDSNTIVELKPQNLVNEIITQSEIQDNQEPKRDEFDLPDDGFNVIHFHHKKNKPLPIYSFTIKNNTNNSQVITGMLLEIIEYYPYASIPKTRLLRPSSVWKVRLPYGEGLYKYYPPKPVIIDKDDAVMIDLKFYCKYRNKKIHPNKTAGYVLKVNFISDNGLIASSEKLKL